MVHEIGRDLSSEVLVEVTLFSPWLSVQQLVEDTRLNCPLVVVQVLHTRSQDSSLVCSGTVMVTVALEEEEVALALLLLVVVQVVPVAMMAKVQVHQT